MRNDWVGKRVLIIGAARQGQAAARFLSKHCSELTINDHRSNEELEEIINKLEGLDIHWVTGSHPLDLLENVDCVCVSGGIPLDLPIIVEAIKRRIPLTNDTELFMEEVPCRTIGITGSAGKTTVTTLLGNIMKKYYSDRPETAWVGGNIGDPLLNYIDQIDVNDLAVMELSSFQLEQMTLMPDIAVVLNVTPNHLDRHKTMAAYVAAKSRIVNLQSKDSITILGRDDPNAWEMRNNVRGELLSFGFSHLEKSNVGLEFAEGKFIFRDSSSNSREIMDLSLIHLRGDHNILNTMAACLTSLVVGIDDETIRSVVDEFYGAPHRLEHVRTWKGVEWYDDSIATTPERTMAAIHSFREPIILLLGGRDKDLDWDELVGVIQDHVRVVILFGEARGKISKALNKIPIESKKFVVEQFESLQEAVNNAYSMAKSGDVVLLSPGGTSFDEFRDFEDRGERYQQWVRNLS